MAAPSSPRSPSDSAEGATFGVFAAAMCGFLAIGSTLPVLPRYVHGPRGGGDLAVGIVIGAFAVTAVVARPFAGRLADARGRRPVVVIGLCLSGLAGACYFLPFGVPGLVLARLVLGIAEGFVFTAGATWTVDLAGEERRGRALGLFGLGIWIALSTGPLIGEGLLQLGGYSAVWGFAICSPLVGAVIARRLPERHLPPDPQSAGSDGLLPRAALRPGAALALAAVGFSTLASFVVLDLEHQGIAHAPVSFVAFASAVVVMRTIGGRLPDVIGGRRTAIAAAGAEAIGLAVIALSHSLGVAILGAVVMGSGFSVLFPSFALLVVNQADDSRRGAALGAFTAFFDAGVGLGGLLAGAIAGTAGYPAAFWVAAACAAGSVLVTLSTPRERLGTTRPRLGIGAG